VFWGLGASVSVMHLPQSRKEKVNLKKPKKNARRRPTSNETIAPLENSDTFSVTEPPSVVPPVPPTQVADAVGGFGDAHGVKRVKPPLLCHAARVVCHAQARRDADREAEKTRRDETLGDAGCDSGSHLTYVRRRVSTRDATFHTSV
jgi:hypothetical protein